MSTNELRTPQWWLAEIDQHGNPKLIDGSHVTRFGADQAAYIIRGLGLGEKGRRFAVARVELSEVEDGSAGVNEEAIATMRPLIQRYKAPREPIVHGPFDHTPRCTTGACND